MTGPRVVVGAVLCGGASRRMGRDKALVEVDGRPLARRVAEALHAGGCRGALAVGGDAAALAALGLLPVADRWPGQGPLGGLTSAVLALPAGTRLVLAPCDLITPSPRVVATLLGELASATPGIDVAVPLVDDRPEWVHSAWRVTPDLGARLHALVAGGARRLDAVAAVADHVVVTGVGRRAVADVDRPEDLPGGTEASSGDGRGRVPTSMRPPPTERNRVDVTEVDIPTFAGQHAAGVTVVDVREPDEYVAGHVPGALLIPLSEVPDRVEEVPRGETVYVVCATGRRSARAAEHLSAQGRDAVNVAGGTKGWVDAGHPTVVGDAP